MQAFAASGNQPSAGCFAVPILLLHLFFFLYSHASSKNFILAINLRLVALVALFFIFFKFISLTSGVIDKLSQNCCISGGHCMKQINRTVMQPSLHFA